MTPAEGPHPDATAEEGPGILRRNEIHPFPGGMRPGGSSSTCCWHATLDRTLVRKEPCT